MTKDSPDPDPDPDGIGTPIESGHRAASGIGIFDIEAVVCRGYLGVDCGRNYAVGSLVIGR
ncbi:MAG: hypothetical protein IIB53_16715 [Planctomycetes bacterium]|nr:hypothetical protein [Planctomycetota bacterium]